MRTPSTGSRDDGHRRPTAGRRRDLRATAPVPQPPWRRLVNPFTPLELLSADQVEAIHQAGLVILRDIGMEVLGTTAVDRFAAAGAGDGVRVERPDGTATRAADGRGVVGRVRLDPDFAAGLVARAPARFELAARNPARRLVFGDRHLVVCAVGGPAFVSDLDRGRRPGTQADLEAYLRVIGALDVIHQEGGGPLEAQDLPVATRHLDLYRAQATLLDKAWQCSAFGRGVVDDALEVAAIALGTTRAGLLADPALMTIVNSNSPLRLDGPMADGLVAMAEAGQAVVATPFTLAGAMTPATLAGALAQQHAEALFMVALTQLVRPGAPVVYGGFTSNVDMRTGSPSFGTPEYVQGQLATGQLARHVGLPWRTSNVTASPVADVQAATESAMSAWGAVTAGANLLYQGAGWLEGGLTASFEKLVLDAELLGSLAAVLAPVEVSADTLGLDAIADVGPGGHFLGSPHTLARYETAFHRPMLAEQRTFEAWADDGARTATERANATWKRLLAEYEVPSLPPDRAEALEAFVTRRKRELLAGA